jgi:hypothetical protein
LRKDEGFVLANLNDEDRKIQLVAERDDVGESLLWHAPSRFFVVARSAGGFHLSVSRSWRQARLAQRRLANKQKAGR